MNFSAIFIAPCSFSLGVEAQSVQSGSVPIVFSSPSLSPTVLSLFDSSICTEAAVLVSWTLIRIYCKVISLGRFIADPSVLCCTTFKHETGKNA